ncbi:tripartite tricarboxylate transporter substrate-binding protein [Variovorax sp. J22P168]|uniref:tripartite tricarboxylate transporter substrate-binding protein n=1 Tax=Variovorax jilinensis TaxID=3053513 RepID=UPI002578AD81|nr:tripartite tricarboxylate transporter substrate-binding protein [Variovorax sp. J22P168]MDM0012011.1 tripartite tricarboxylate transporter substrate-binding protein [Variovorax sp. J22P168]
MKLAFPQITRRRLLLAGAAVGALPAGLAHAQPEGVTRFIVPVPAGGGMDSTARLIAEGVRDVIGTVIVENKPGGALRIALQYVKAAAPDGKTLLYTTLSPLTIYPHVYQKLGYDAVSDLIPVAPVVSYDFALAVPGSSPISSLAEYLEAVKRNPEKMGLYAVPAAGTSLHFLGVALAQAANVPLTVVPYKGSAPAMQDLVGGQVPACINVLGEFLQYRAAGKVKILATAGAQRSTLTPDVPTFSELGFKSLVMNEQFGLFAPAKTPPATVARINTAVSDAMRKPEMQKRVAEMGYGTLILTPAAFEEKVRKDRDLWRPLVKASGFSLDE